MHSLVALGLVILSACAPGEEPSSAQEVVSDTLDGSTSAATALTSTTDAPLVEATEASRGSDEAAVVDGVSAEEQQRAARFCGLVMRSNELVSESFGAPSLEPFDRDQAALAGAMVALAPDDLQRLVSRLDASYDVLIDVLDGAVSLSTAEYEGFLRDHLELTSDAQGAFNRHIFESCDETLGDMDFVAAVLAGDVGGENEIAAPVTDDEGDSASPGAAPSTGGDPSPAAPGTGTGDTSNMPIAGGTDYPFDTPTLPTPVAHGIPTGRYTIASTRWEATEARPALLLTIYMRVSTNHVVVGAGCELSAADYERRAQVVIDSVHTIQTAFGPSSTSWVCGVDESGGLSSGMEYLYFFSEYGWRQHVASVSAMFTDRATGQTTTVEGTVRFADYRR